MEISKDFKITKKGYENGYNVEYFQRAADDILRHHFNDDFHLYVTSYATCLDGSPWKNMAKSRKSSELAFWPNRKRLIGSCRIGLNAAFWSR